jgi:hypothetical protein
MLWLCISALDEGGREGIGEIATLSYLNWLTLANTSAAEVHKMRRKKSNERP